MASLKRWSTVAVVLGLATACGGSEKKVSEPALEVAEEPEESEELIPEEKFEEIQSTFERKASSVARCFPIAVESGEVDKNDRVEISVGLVIQPDGSPSKVEILGTSKRSEALEACVVKTVGRWQFTTLSRPLQYSYGFKLQSF